MKALRIIEESWSKSLKGLYIAHLIMAFLPWPVAMRLRPKLYRLVGFKIGLGTVIMGNLSVDIDTGSYSNLRVGNHCYIGANCHITLNAPVVIGDNTTLTPFVKLFTDSHYMDNPLKRHGDLFSKPITVNKGAFIGTSAIILPGVTIGEGAVVGAGAVVSRDVSPHCVAVGVPSREVKELDY